MIKTPMINKKDIKKQNGQHPIKDVKKIMGGKK